jgi:dynein heavy chain 2
MAQVFQSLAPVNALRISDFSAPEWLAGKEEYERRMAPIEQRLSQKLRELFGE